MSTATGLSSLSALACVGHSVSVRVDVNGLEILSREECLHLLATGRLGHLGLSFGALPVVLPVNYAVLDDNIIVRSAPGTKFDAALTNAVVAFEVARGDGPDDDAWSVMVQGIASVITDPAALARAHALDLQPWAGGPKDNFVSISVDTISGRRVLP